MEFTEAYKQTGPCCFSPNARYIAVAVDYRLVIRDTLSFKDNAPCRCVYSYTVKQNTCRGGVGSCSCSQCLDKISYIEWALDSEYILCGLYKRPMIQAWSLAQPEWTCKIDEGPAGIAYARWSPDSRHILTTSDFQLRLTVWSLLNTACVHVQWPKHLSKGVSFTKDGKFAAICTRRDCKDYLIFCPCQTWEIMGGLIYFRQMGVSSGGSYDQNVAGLNHLTWKTFAEFMHLSTVRSPCCAAVFKEVDEPLLLDIRSYA
ncbi:hypothetical protein M0R45_037775 [Rubus argutus]|uniref:Uncharacterized protein n=1 Tax=Rubus argutus TaxID=59490 RepID=A0AAW1W347_RUBAR